jgi:hypothetical protein
MYLSQRRPFVRLRILLTSGPSACASIRSPLPAGSPVACRNARLIGIVFFQRVQRSGVEARSAGAENKS